MKRLSIRTTTALLRPRRPQPIAPACAALAVALLGGPLWAQQTAAAPPLPMAQRQERNALAIRAATERLDRDFTPARYGLMDAALADNAALTQRARAEGESVVANRLAWDRVVALQLRGDAAGALAAYQALPAGMPPAPAYVRQAVAGALLAQRQPEAAGAIYRELLAATPQDLSLHHALMYAELESEQLDDAQHRADAAAGAFPNMLAARRAQATMLRFTDQLGASQAAVTALLRERPEDAGLWLEQADLFMARGLPRAAERRYRDVLAREAGNIPARIGLANAAWAQGDIADAARRVEELVREAPEHTGVQRLQRAWQRQQRPLSVTELTRGFGVGVIDGDADFTWNSTLYSGTWDSGLRVYARHHLAQARFSGNQASHERVGGGLQWSLRDLQLSAELSQDLRNAHDSGWAVAGAWQLDDHWSLRARHESQTDDFPLKGRQPGSEAWAPYHLHAAKTSVSVSWRANESRRVDARLSHYDFNDGNTRQALDASWTERLYSRNGDSVDLVGAFYTSRNSLPDTVYFNPSHDTALSLTLAGDWLTWRRYERHFRQRVAVTMGSYHQQSDVRPAPGLPYQTLDHGWKPFTELRYEHEWQWAPERVTRYGVGVRRFPYDGRAETRLFVYLQHTWRF